MTTQRWALLHLNQILTQTGFNIVVTTYEPVHLWMRWTLIEPQVHKIPRTRRGISLLDDKYYCFDVYHDNEQEEAGDTYLHTFVKEPWAYCETRWFYFHGEISGVPSPSTSPIFKKHRLPAELTTVFHPDAHPEVTSVDGYAGNPPFGTWSFVHGGTALDAQDDTDYLFVRLRCGYLEDDWYQFYRSPILWDISSIIGDKVLSAFISLYGVTKGDQIGLSPTINIFDSSPVSNTSIVVADYQNVGSMPQCDSPISYLNFNDSGWNHFPLNAVGIVNLQYALSTDGIAKFGIREAKWDAPNIEPNWYGAPWNPWSGFAVYSADKGGHYRPRLTITHIGVL